MKKRSRTERKRIKFVHPLNIVYAIIILLTTITGCEIPMNTEAQQIIAPEVVVTPEIIEPEEEIIMTMNPISVYEKYAVNENGRVLGLNGKELEPVFLTDTDDNAYQFNEFFVKDGTLFFSTEVMEDVPDTDPVERVEKTYCFSQGKGVIVEIPELPSKPISKRQEMGITPWSIVSGDYNGTPISSVKQVISEDRNPVTNFLNIDSYFVTPDGLWFSAPEGIENTAIEKGLYFWALGSGAITNVSEYYRIW
jgi:hypothetical protein